MKISNTFSAQDPQTAYKYTRTDYFSDAFGTTRDTTNWGSTNYTASAGHTSSTEGHTALAYTRFAGLGGTNQSTGVTYSAQLGSTYEAGFSSTSESSFASRYQTMSYYLSGTKYTTSSSSTIDTFSSYNEEERTLYSEFSVEVGTTSRRTTTDIVDAHTTYHTVVSGSLTTSTMSTTVKSNYSTWLGTDGFPEGDYVWQTYSTSSAGTSATTVTLTGYGVGGWAISAEDSDWLWSVTNSVGAFSPSSTLIKDCAITIDEATVWFTNQTESVDFATYNTFLDWSVDIPDNRGTHTVDYLAVTGTGTTTLTTGANLSRDTYTRSYYLYGTSQSTFETGTEGGSWYALSTSTRSCVTTAVEQITVNALMFVGWGDQTTTTLNSTTQKLVTSVSYYEMPYYQNGTSWTAGMAYGETGFSKEETGYKENTATFFGGGAGGARTNYNAVAPYDAMMAPQALLGEMFSHSYGGNVQFAGGQIYYPETASVYSNVVVPMPRNYSTTDGSSNTWRYKWSNDGSNFTLNYSRQATAMSGSSTVTNETTGSGTLNTVSAKTHGNFEDGGSVFGGYPAKTDQPETVHYGPKAVFGVGISTDGATSTYRTVVNSAHSFTAHERLVVEQSAAAVQSYVSSGANPFGGIINFARHQSY